MCSGGRNRGVTASSGTQRWGRRRIAGNDTCELSRCSRPARQLPIEDDALLERVLRSLRRVDGPFERTVDDLQDRVSLPDADRKRSGEREQANDQPGPELVEMLDETEMVLVS